MVQPQERVLIRINQNNIVKPLIILGVFIALFWGIEIIDFLSGFFWDFDQHGIRPRSINSIDNIFIAPFLHGGFSHVAANSVPFLVLGALIMWRSMRDFWMVTLIVIIISGAGIWLFGGVNTIHLGASGIVFGYLGYLLFLGWFERSPRAIITAVIVGMLYSGVIWGVLPLEEGVSWQGHLFGFIGGIVCARLLAERARSPF